MHKAREYKYIGKVMTLTEACKIADVDRNRVRFQISKGMDITSAIDYVLAMHGNDGVVIERSNNGWKKIGCWG